MSVAHAIPRLLASDGFALIPDVLTPNDVGRLRAAVRDHLAAQYYPLGFGRTQPNAAIEVAGISWLFAHPSILTIFREAIGSPDLMFTSHCDIHGNALSGWHKDSGDHVPGSYFGISPYGVDDCRVYKAALYLQDHGDDEGALRVRVGSHTTSALDAGEVRVLHPGIGDLVLFDVRLSHSGESATRWQRRLHRALDKTPGLGDRFHMPVRNFELRLRRRVPRYSVFFTFGLANPMTAEFSIRSMRRQIEQYPSTTTRLAPALREHLRARGVALAEDADGWPDAPLHSRS